MGVIYACVFHFSRFVDWAEQKKIPSFSFNHIGLPFDAFSEANLKAVIPVTQWVFSPEDAEESTSQPYLYRISESVGQSTLYGVVIRRGAVNASKTRILCRVFVWVVFKISSKLFPRQRLGELSDGGIIRLVGTFNQSVCCVHVFTILGKVARMISRSIAILSTIFRLGYRCWMRNFWREDVWAAFSLISDCRISSYAPFLIFHKPTKFFAWQISGSTSQ